MAFSKDSPAQGAGGSFCCKATGSSCRSPTPGPAGDPPALEPAATEASPPRSATSWRTSGRTSRVATPWAGTSPALRGSSSSISRCSGGSGVSFASARTTWPTPGPPPQARPKITPRSSSAWPGPQVRPGRPGAGDRRPASNLYRRVIMLVQDHEPLERRCRTPGAWPRAWPRPPLIVVASGLRLGAAAAPVADATAKEAQAAQDAAKTPADRARPPGRRCRYKGTVKDKDTGKPIAGATVVVRRSINRSGEDRVLQETRHTTGSRRYLRVHDPAGSGRRALPLHRAGRRAPQLRPAGRVRLRPGHDPQEREARRAALLRDYRAAPGPADHRAGRDARGPARGRGAGAGVLAHRQGPRALPSTVASPRPGRMPRVGSGCRSPRPARACTGSCPRIMPPSCSWSPRGSAATWGPSP